MTIQHAVPVQTITPTIHRDEVAPNRRRGGDIRTLLSPANVGAKSGFMGTLTLKPGEVVTEHWHPYSEEFIYCVSGTIAARLNGEPRRLGAGDGIWVAIGVRHRLVNDGDADALCVFTCAPLAPRPDLGHVDTEPPPAPNGSSS